MKKKNGFISTTIIYSFFLVFILLILAMLMSYSNKFFLKNKIASNIIDPGDGDATGYLECKNGDKLSDCLFLAEAREASELGDIISEVKNEDWWNQFDETNSTNNNKLFTRYMIYQGLMPSRWNVPSKEGKLEDFNTEKKVEKIKNEILQRTNYFFGGELISKYDYGNGLFYTSKLGEPTILEEGMYQKYDDYGTSYFYRGAEDDNYVSYAGKTWRIIRINGNGTIRMILDEPINLSEPILFNSDTTIIGELGNVSGNNTRYGMGYMSLDFNGWFTNLSYYDRVYQNRDESDVKKRIDDWYDKNVTSEYESFLDQETIFCGDKDIMNNDLEAEFFNGGEDGSGISAWLKKINTNFNGKRIGMYYFATMSRLANLNAAPVLTCSPSGNAAKSDCHKNLNLSAYSVVGKRKYPVGSNDCNCSINTTFPICDGQPIATSGFIGNGALDNPIATISADEVVLAGGALGKENKDYYLYSSNSNKHTWTMTPGFLDQSKFISKYVEDGVFTGDYEKNTFFFGKITKENAKGAYYFAIGSNGELMLVNSYASDDSNVNQLKGLVRPVVNLKSNILYCDGSGTASDPYIIGNGSCK